MRARARFHPDQAWLEFLEKSRHLTAGQLPTHHDSLAAIDPMHLEHVLSDSSFSVTG
jgi:hypothetical protein